MNHALFFGVVEVLLGGRKAKHSRVEDREFTKIERAMVAELTNIMLRDMIDAFEPVAPVEFKYERMESNPRLHLLRKKTTHCILVTVRISLDGREGKVQFCMPYATLEPIREQLLQKFAVKSLVKIIFGENHLAKTYMMQILQQK